MRVRVTRSDADKLFQKQAPGKEGIFLQECCKPEERRCRPLRLPQAAGLGDAERQAKSVPWAAGVSCGRRGELGVLVPKDRFKEAATKLLGEETANHLVCPRYMIEGVPLSWSKWDVQNICRAMDWPAAIEQRPLFATATKTRTWFARSDTAPDGMIYAHREHNFLIQPAESKPPPRRRPPAAGSVQRWNASMARAAPAAPVPREWKQHTDKPEENALPTQVDAPSQAAGSQQRQQQEQEARGAGAGVGQAVLPAGSVFGALQPVAPGGPPLPAQETGDVQQEILRTLRVLQASMMQLRSDVDDLQLGAHNEDSSDEAGGGGQDVDPLGGGGDAGMSGVARKRRGKELQGQGSRARESTA